MITLRQVRKAFDDQVVLDNLDLEVPQRQDYRDNRAERRGEECASETYDRSFEA